MNKSDKIEGTMEAWEDGTLGCDGDYAERSSLINEIKLDEAMKLKTISIRLEESLIEDFKIIADKNKMRYQPLMKQVLKRFASAEMKNMIRQLRVDEMKKREEEEDDTPKTSACG